MLGGPCMYISDCLIYVADVVAQVIIAFHAHSYVRNY